MTSVQLYFISFLLIWKVFAIDNPEELVNLLAGTFTDGDSFSTGNTLPLIARPWGFNHWAPQTKDKRHGSWWFNGNVHELKGIRCTHQPSPWIGDWGYFIFNAQISHNVDRSPTLYFEPRGATIKPYYFDATVAPFNIRIEMTPTMHGAIARFTFPPEDSGIIGEFGRKRVCFSDAGWLGFGKANEISGSPAFIHGVSTQVTSDRLRVNDFHMQVFATSTADSGEVTAENHNDMYCFVYGSYGGSNSHKGDQAIVRIVTSFISKEQALISLERELPVTKSFDDILAESKSEWHEMLSRVEISDSEVIKHRLMELKNTHNINIADYDINSPATDMKYLTIFYTSLARALYFPRRIEETDASGNFHHWSPYGGGVHPGILVTDNGFWDTFRTVYPLLSLIYPDALGDIVQGWLNAYKSGGWLPSWASPGYRNCMVGTFADVVVSDAVIKRIPGFDLKMAYDALRKDAFEEPPGHAGNAVGKEGLSEYRSLGYISMGPGDSVSRTLDFAYADFATANAFRVLAGYDTTSDTEGISAELKSQLKNEKFVQDRETHFGSPEVKKKLNDEADELMARAFKALRIMYDSGSGLMTPHDRAGNSKGINSLEWGNGYVEGNAWHHSFPQWAVPELAKIHAGNSVTGGNGPLLNRLHQLIALPGTFSAGSYHREIHEMTEARAVAMGQYAHNNQPSHHILFLFGLLYDRYTMEETVHSILDRAYGVDFFAGDEDNGEMCSWFVLAALGLFPVAPGALEGGGHYVLTTPLFTHSRIHIPVDISTATSDKDVELFSIDIVAIGASHQNIHTSAVTLNEVNIPSFVKGVPYVKASSGLFGWGGSLLRGDEKHASALGNVVYYHQLMPAKLHHTKSIVPLTNIPMSKRKRGHVLQFMITDETRKEITNPFISKALLDQIMVDVVHSKGGSSTGSVDPHIAELARAKDRENELTKNLDSLKGQVLSLQSQVQELRDHPSPQFVPDQPDPVKIPNENPENPEENVVYMSKIRDLENNLNHYEEDVKALNAEKDQLQQRVLDLQSSLERANADVALDLSHPLGVHSHWNGGSFFKVMVKGVVLISMLLVLIAGVLYAYIFIVVNICGAPPSIEDNADSTTAVSDTVMTVANRIPCMSGVFGLFGRLLLQIRSKMSSDRMKSEVYNV